MLKLFVYRVFNVVLGWLYYAILESYQIQGTLGKQVIGISVTDLQGDKISFGKATARYFGKSFFLVILVAAGLISSIGKVTGNENSPYLILAIILIIVGLIILFVGYLMAAVTPEKQALHDIMARCLVVRASGQPRVTPWKSLVALGIAVFLSGKVYGMIRDVDEATIRPQPSTVAKRIFGDLIQPHDRLKGV